MSVPVKPEGMSRSDEWAWENGSETMRLMLAWAYERIEQRRALQITEEEMLSCKSPQDVLRLHTRWKAALDATPRGKAARAKRERARRYLAQSGARPVYVRLGEAPPDGLSRNHHFGICEGGLCCFRGYQTPEGRVVIDPGEDGPLPALLMVLMVSGRPPFLVTGREVGTGTGGEPLLAEPFWLEPVPRERLESLVRYPWTLRALTWWDLLLAGELGRPPDPGPGSLERVPPLVRKVLARATGKLSVVHGPEHWKRVAVAGAALIEETPAADALVVLCFALFHDAMRLDDGHDPDHGQRGADLARELLAEPSGSAEAPLSEEQLDVLAYACEHHDAGGASDDPTVAVCWDADRLNLWRVGTRPDPVLLSTVAAKRPERIEWARKLQKTQLLTWSEVLERFGLSWVTEEAEQPIEEKAPADA